MPAAGSGVAVLDDCGMEFEKMKNSKAYYGIVYKVSDDFRFIEVDKKFENPTGDETDTTIDEYQKFVNHLLQMADCRFACYDVRFTTGEGVRRRELVFIHYQDYNDKTINTLGYANSRDTLKSKLIGFSTQIQAEDADDLALDEILQVIKA